jgi:hypothetical protein
MARTIKHNYVIKNSIINKPSIHENQISKNLDRSNNNTMLCTNDNNESLELRTCAYCKKILSRTNICYKHMKHCKYRLYGTNINKTLPNIENNNSDQQPNNELQSDASESTCMQRHGMVKLPEKPLSICVCNKAYLYKRNLDRHQLTCEIYANAS